MKKTIARCVMLMTVFLLSACLQTGD